MRRLCMIICLVVVLTVTGLFASAVAMGQYEEQAVQLQSLGLLKGSSTGFDLLRIPKRVESAVMLVRLLGKETEVLAGTYTHPFNDVPTWAQQYIGYMYENQLTKGKTATTFGSNDLTDAKSYMTFVLRALGYSDSQGDFTWAGALKFAVEKGVVSTAEANALGTKIFLRDDMVLLSANALKANLKNSPDQLIDKLVQSGAISQTKVDQSPLFVEPIVLKIKTAIVNGVLTTTLDTSTLRMGVNDKITDISSFVSGSRTNAYSKEEMYLICNQLTSGPVLWGTPVISHQGSPYVTEILCFYVNQKLYGMTQIVSPTVGEKEIVVTPWLEDEYNEIVKPKLDNITMMVKNARVIQASDIGWARASRGYYLFDSNSKMADLDVSYVSVAGSNMPWNEKSIIDSLIGAIAMDGEVVSEYSKVLKPLQKIKMSASDIELLPHQQGSVVLLFDTEKTLVAYSILNQEMPKETSSYLLVLKKNEPYSGGNDDITLDEIQMELSKINISVQVGGKEIFRVAGGMVSVQGMESVKIRSEYGYSSDPDNPQAGYSVEVFFDDVIFSPDSKPIVTIIGDNFGYQAELIQ